MKLRFLNVLICAAGLVLGSCGVSAQVATRQPAAPLEHTEWTLTWVAGVKIPKNGINGGSPRTPYIELDPASHRLTGSGGCNRLMGGYELEGDRLRLTGTARTMMACLNAGDTEDKLVKALEQTREWRVSRQTLELPDSDHNVLARFRAAAAE